MNQIYYTYEDTLVLAAFLIFVIAVVLISYLYRVVCFFRDSDYIKMEMKRTRGKEHQFWKNELKKMYLQLIPFFGRFFK